MKTAYNEGKYTHGCEANLGSRLKRNIVRPTRVQRFSAEELFIMNEKNVASPEQSF